MVCVFVGFRGQTGICDFAVLIFVIFNCTSNSRGYSCIELVQYYISAFGRPSTMCFISIDTYGTYGTHVRVSVGFDGQTAICDCAVLIFVIF